MTKVAVISADGRIAGHVIKELVARGYDVTGFGRRDENTTGHKHTVNYPSLK